MLSLFTPVHASSAPFLPETYASLLAQTVREWEWVLVENHGGVVPDHVRSDRRVRVLAAPPEMEGIGALKRFACLACTGSALVELDADDLLAPHALSALAQALEEGADFVFSDFAAFENKTWRASWDGTTSLWGADDGYPYGAAFGWSTYPTSHLGHELIAMRAPPATPQNMRRVTWAPNHVRCWSQKAYLDVGGHDPALGAGDDHDLIVRTYLAGKKMVHLPACLYFYRVHEHNTVATQTPAIQRVTEDVYNKSLFRMAEKDARDRGLLLVDLCGGVDCPPGYLSLDLEMSEEAIEAGGVPCDLDDTWPLQDNSVGLLRASDAVEHLRDPIHTMNEAYRVLAPGGWLLIDVPSTDGRGAFCDSTHVSFWNSLSFRYFTEPEVARKYARGFKGRFQKLRVLDWYPSPWHRENLIPYVQAHLVAVKPGYAPMGGCGWPAQP